MSIVYRLRTITAVQMCVGLFYLDKKKSYPLVSVNTGSLLHLLLGYKNKIIIIFG